MPCVTTRIYDPAKASLYLCALLFIALHRPTIGFPRDEGDGLLSTLCARRSLIFQPCPYSLLPLCSSPSLVALGSFNSLATRTVALCSLRPHTLLLVSFSLSTTPHLPTYLSLQSTPMQTVLVRSVVTLCVFNVVVAFGIGCCISLSASCSIDPLLVSYPQLLARAHCSLQMCSNQFRMYLHIVVLITVHHYCERGGRAATA